MKPSKLHIVYYCLLAFSLFYYSCRNENVVTPSEDHTPMWPMFGFNGRHSANPFGVKVNIPVVNNGVIYWIDTLASVPGTFNDGSELCADAK